MDGAIVVRANGGSEVLEWTQSDPGQPGPGEVLIRHTAVGLNFIDCYQRSGLYPMDLPLTLGTEAAGADGARDRPCSTSPAALPIPRLGSPAGGDARRGSDRP